MIMEYRGLAWSIVASRSVLEGWCVYWSIGEHHGKSRVSRCIAENDGAPTIRCSVPTRHTNILEYIKVSSNSAEYHGLKVCCGRPLRTGVLDNIEEHRGILLGWRGIRYQATMDYRERSRDTMEYCEVVIRLGKSPGRLEYHRRSRCVMERHEIL